MRFPGIGGIINIPLAQTHKDLFFTEFFYQTYAAFGAYAARAKAARKREIAKLIKSFGTACSESSGKQRSDAPRRLCTSDERITGRACFLHAMFTRCWVRFQRVYVFSRPVFPSR